MILRGCKDAIFRGYRRSVAALSACKEAVVNACVAVALILVGSSAAMAQTSGTSGNTVTPIDIGIDLSSLAGIFGTKMGAGIAVFFGLAIPFIVLWRIWRRLKTA